MQIVKIANWLLEVDTEKTRELYHINQGGDECDCLYCHNFVEASKSLDTDILQVFQQLGIPIEKPAHLSDIPISDDKMIRYYVGNYHFVGRVIEGEVSTVSTWDETNTLQMSNFRIGLCEQIEYAPDNLPDPVLQLDFETDLPWVLEEEPEEI